MKLNYWKIICHLSQQMFLFQIVSFLVISFPTIVSFSKKNFLCILLKNVHLRECIEIELKREIQFYPNFFQMFGAMPLIKNILR